jgi:dihydrofolate reductase
MGRVSVIEFVSIDGVIEDPAGSEGFEHGGWAFRFGPEAVAGDKFKLGSLMETGSLVLGRATWELFAEIWPGRDDEFAKQMNAIPKLVASSSHPDLDRWSNSAVLEGDLVEEVTARKRSTDLVICGSASVVGSLSEQDLIDEIRLLVFPIIIGSGRRLFDYLRKPLELKLNHIEQSGAAALLVYQTG